MSLEIGGVRPGALNAATDDPESLLCQKKAQQAAATFTHGGTARTLGAPALPGVQKLAGNANVQDLGLTLGATDPEMMKGLQSLKQALGLDPNTPLDLGKLSQALQNVDAIGDLRKLGLETGDTLEDPKTMDAIKKLQEAAGINPTGHLDLETLLALVQAAQNQNNNRTASSTGSVGNAGGTSGGSAAGAGGLSSVSRREAPGPQQPGMLTRMRQGVEDAVGIPSGSLSANQKEAYQAALQGDPAHGVPPLSPTAARALVANMTGESLSKPNDNHWDVRHMSQGIVQWDPGRAAAIKKEFGKEPKDMTVAEQTKAAVWEITHNPRFSKTKNALLGNSSPQQMVDALVRNYEVPGNPGAQVAKRMGFFNSLSALA